VGWPEIGATFKVAPPSTELRTGSIIRATCAFDAKKVVPGMKTGELTRCQKRSKKNFLFSIFTSGYLRIWSKIVSFDTRGLLWNLLLLLVLDAVYELEQIQEKLL